MKKIFLLLMVLITLFCGTVSCQKDGKNSDDSEPIIGETVKKQSLILNSYEKTVNEGENFLLEYRTKNIVGKVNFSSSNEKVATVSGAGEVKGLIEGKCNVTAEIGNLTAVCAVTVKAAPIAEISLSKYEITLVAQTDDSYKIHPVLFKNRSEIVGVTYEFKSYDESIATVTKNGVVFAKGLGDTEIAITCVYDGETYYSTLNVAVTDGTYIDVEREITVDIKRAKRTIDYAVKNYDDTEISGAVAEITADDDICEIVNENEVKLLSTGVTYINLKYGKATARVKFNIVLEVDYNEYNCLFNEDMIKGVSVFRLDGTDVANYNSKGQYSLTKEDIGDKHTGDGKLSVLAKTKDGNKMPFISICVPARQSLKNIVALKAAGYTKLCVDIYIDMPDSSTGGYINCFNKLYSREPSCVRVPTLRKWFTYAIPIDDVIANYAVVQSGEKGLISVQPDETENDPWQIYLSAISFEK